MVLAAKGCPSSQLSGTTGEHTGAVDPWKEAADGPLSTAGFSFQDLFSRPLGPSLKTERRHLLSLYKPRRKAARS